MRSFIRLHLNLQQFTTVIFNAGKFYMGLIFVFSMILKSRNDVYSYKENVSVRVIFYKDIRFKPERSSVPDESEQTPTF